MKFLVNLSHVRLHEIYQVMYRNLNCCYLILKEKFRDRQLYGVNNLLILNLRSLLHATHAVGRATTGRHVQTILLESSYNLNIFI